MRSPERWLSGRKRRTRNPVYGSPYRGFESHPFRQSNKSDQWSLLLFEGTDRLFLNHVPVKYHCRARSTACPGACLVMVHAGLNRVARAGIARHLPGRGVGAAGEGAIGTEGNAGAFCGGAICACLAAASHTWRASTLASRISANSASGADQACSVAGTPPANSIAR